MATVKSHRGSQGDSTPIPPARPSLGERELDAAEKVIRSGNISQGLEVAAFEAEFSGHVGGRECVAVNSGTSALHLGMLASGIGSGDEVIVPSFTFAATANSVALTGATPVFADIDPRTYCMDAGATAAAITSRTVAIMPVHLFGQPAEMSAMRELCNRHGLLLLEDAAQAHGATWRGAPAGSLGDLAAFSFYATKNMTTGEGGMVVTNDAAVARAARLLRNQGMEKRYVNEVVGFNNRMTDLQAAIGRVQLERLPELNRQRQSNAVALSVALGEMDGVRLPSTRAGATHVYHQYTIRVKGGLRDSFVASLGDSGIGTSVYYRTPTHMLPSFGSSLDLPVTVATAREVVSLPVYPTLTPADLTRIVDAVDRAVTGFRNPK